MGPIFALMMGMAAALVLLELGCQAFALGVMREWDALRADSDHYYQASESPTLGYELAPALTIERDGRVLRINEHGIRDSSDEVPGEETHKIAILGDSVVFGIYDSQECTISARLQSLIDPSGVETRVLSFGVPGYSLEQMLTHLRRKDEVYRVDHIVYVLNPNDFTRHGMVSEGGSNGLYRMYRPPVLKSPWMIRKAIYRWHKSGGRVSAEWYRWVFRTNGGAWREHLDRLGAYARESGKGLTVVLLPAGSAYRGEAYLLADIAEEVAAHLRRAGIDVVDPRPAFAGEPACFTETDHLSSRGNQLMADVLAAHLTDRGIPIPRGISVAAGH